MREPGQTYLEKAKKLKKGGIERLLARARKKLTRRLDDQETSVLKVVAIQLEIEDEELAEWRVRWAEIQKKTKTHPKTK